MKYLNILLSLVFCLFLIQIVEAQQDATKRVLLIGIAGVSSEEFQYANTPVIDKIISQGAISLRTRGVIPSESAANWVSVLSGAGPEQHGVISNNWNQGNQSIEPTVKDVDGYFPSIFTLIRKQRPKAVTGMFYDWDQLGSYINKKLITKEQYVQGQVMITAVALNFIRKEKPVFTFIYYGLPYVTGNSTNFNTKEYYQSINEIDTEIGKIVSGLQEAKMMNTTIIITSDQGISSLVNGIESTADLEVPWISSGSGIQKNVLLEIPNDHINTAPTIARILGLKTPAEWKGKPVLDAYIPKTSKTKSGQYVPKPWCSLAEGAFPGPQQIELSTTRQGAVIYYSLDGSAPGVTSKKYTTAFTINKNCILKAVSVSGANQSQTINRTYTFVQGIRSATLTTEPSPKYAGSGVSGLFDGLIGSANQTNKQWMGFEGDNFEVTVDLGEVKPVKALGIDVLKLQINLIFLPSAVEFYISDDGIAFKLLKTYYPAETDDPMPDGLVMLSLTFDNIKTQFIRIKATNIGTCPPGHKEEGQKAWLFVSEVEIE